MQIGQHGHRSSRQPSPPCVGLRSAPELDFKIQDQDSGDGQQDERHDTEYVRHALETPPQVDRKRNDGEGRRGDHEIDKALDTHRPQHSPELDVFRIRKDIAAKDFTGPQRQYDVGKQAGEYGANRAAQADFAERCEQEFPTQRLDAVAENIAGHPHHDPLPVHVGEVSERTNKMEIVQDPDQADGSQSIA